jgi:hypothetical protein
VGVWGPPYRFCIPAKPGWERGLGPHIPLPVLDTLMWVGFPKWRRHSSSHCWKRWWGQRGERGGAKPRSGARLGPTWPTLQLIQLPGQREPTALGTCPT